MTLRQAAVYAVGLPPGSATRRRLGGDFAWSDEMHLLSMIEHSVRVLAWQNTKDAERKRNFPKAVEPPRPLHEVQAEEARQIEKARRFKARQERRAQARAERQRQQQELDPDDGG